MDAEQSRSYPPLARLVAPSDLPDVVKRHLTRSLTSLTRRARDVGNPGAFCSEVVAKFFDLLGVQLFKTPVDAHQVSPNRLAGSDSNLRIVHNAILDAGAIKPDAQARVITGAVEFGLSRADLVPMLVAANARAADRERNVSTLIATLGASTERSLAQNRAVWLDNHSQLLQRISSPYPNESPRSTANVTAMFAASLFYLQLDAVLIDQEVQLSDPLIGTELRMAISLLRRHQLLSMLKISQGLLRNTIAYPLHLRRNAPYVQMTRKQRADLLSMWQSGRTTYKSTLEAVDTVGSLGDMLDYDRTECSDRMRVILAMAVEASSNALQEMAHDQLSGSTDPAAAKLV